MIFRVKGVVLIICWPSAGYWYSKVITMITAILEIEDSIISWIFDHIPTIGTFFIATFIAFLLAWKVRGMFYHYTSRLIKVEFEVSELKSDFKSIKRRMTRIERKLDKLIDYLITTRQVDKDALK